MTSLLGITSLAFALATVGSRVYALILRGKYDDMKDRMWIATESSVKRAAQIVEDAEALKAQREHIAKLKTQLAAALLRTGELHELLAKAGAPGAADRFDVLFPDAEPDAIAAGRDAGPVPDRGVTAPAGAEADDLSEVSAPRPRAGDLL